MKNLVFILSLVIGTAANAEYKVGDTVVYASTLQGQIFDLKYEIISVDESADLIKVTESIISNGTVVQSQTGDRSISEDQNELIFDACLQMPSNFNPRYEYITVPAGRFNTCHLTITDGSAVTDGYFSKVLFGIVKLTKTGSTDGSDMSIELKMLKKF